MTNSPQMNRRIADAIDALRKEYAEVFLKFDKRLGAVEDGMVGTPIQAGLVGRFETMKTDFEHKFQQQIALMRINNWLTGLVVAILVAAALKVLFGHAL